jgi:hypothetical protein
VADLDFVQSVSKSPGRIREMQVCCSGLINRNSFEKEFKPKTLTVGSPATAGALANHLTPDWKPQFGIEFSIRSLKKAAASGTTKQSPCNTTSKLKRAMSHSLTQE